MSLCVFVRTRKRVVLFASSSMLDARIRRLNVCAARELPIAASVGADEGVLR